MRTYGTSSVIRALGASHWGTSGGYRAVVAAPEIFLVGRVSRQGLKARTRRVAEFRTWA